MFNHPMSASALHRFAQEHYGPIQNAALLLGGRPWLRRVQRLLDHLQHTPVVTCSTKRQAAAVLGLLTQRDVLRSESACFAALDPADPEADEIWLLAKLLSDALDETVAHSQTREIDAIEERTDV